MQHNHVLTFSAFLQRMYPSLYSVCCLHKYQRRALVAQPTVNSLEKEKCPWLHLLSAGDRHAGKRAKVGQTSQLQDVLSCS